MRKLNGSWLVAMLLTNWLLAPSLWAAVEIPDPTLCDSESKDVRQGRPGGAEGKVVDGLVYDLGFDVEVGAQFAAGNVLFGVLAQGFL